MWHKRATDQSHQVNLVWFYPRTTVTSLFRPQSSPRTPGFELWAQHWHISKITTRTCTLTEMQNEMSVGAKNNMNLLQSENVFLRPERIKVSVKAHPNSSGGIPAYVTIELCSKLWLWKILGSNIQENVFYY